MLRQQKALLHDTPKAAGKLAEVDNSYYPYGSETGSRGDLPVVRLVRATILVTAGLHIVP